MTCQHSGDGAGGQKPLSEVAGVAAAGTAVLGALLHNMLPASFEHVPIPRSALTSRTQSEKLACTR